MAIVIKREQAKRDVEEAFIFLAEDDIDVGIEFLVKAEETSISWQKCRF